MPFKGIILNLVKVITPPDSQLKGGALKICDDALPCLHGLGLNNYETMTLYCLMMCHIAVGYLELTRT